MREAHLHQPAPPLSGNTRLSAFVGQMLRKTPTSRPSLTRCIEVIGSVAETSARPAHAGLLAAAGEVSREAAVADAAAQARAAAHRQRLQEAREATAELDGIIDRLFDDIKAASEEARVSKHTIALGRGTLVYNNSTGGGAVLPQQDVYGSTPEWKVLIGASISLTRTKLQRPSRTAADIRIIHVGHDRPENRDYRWSATLFFGRSQADPNYRWRETAFWSMSRRHEGQDAPFSLEAAGSDFNGAFSNVIGVNHPAYGPFPIDGEDEDAFHQRWLTLFSKAVSGTLNRPSTMPINDYYWQQQ